MNKLYRSPEAKAALMALYEEKLKSLSLAYEERDVPTPFGRTRVIVTGKSDGKPVVLFHGINAGAPLTLEAVQALTSTYRLYAIDTVGQANKSEETRIDIVGNDYGHWAAAVLEGLQLEKAHFIGISYGAYILQKLIIVRPQVVEKAIMVVPSGLVNGKILPSILRLSLPLIRFLITKKETHLRAFTKAFVPEDDGFMLRLQRLTLTGLYMDYRRPKLLQASDVRHFHQAVYLMVAEDDVFFPGHEAVHRAQQLFPNVADTHVLKSARHMPGKQQYPEIATKLFEWMGS